MPRDIFSDVAHPRGAQPRAWYTLPLSILVHAALVAILIVAPLMMADALPSPSLSIVWAAPPPVTPPPPPPPMATQPRATQPASAPSNPNAAPVNAPDNIGEEKPSGPPALPGVVGGVEGFGEVGGVHSGLTVPVAPTPPPPPADAKPMRPGGLIRYPQKVRDVRPIYPQIAVASRYEGRVIIDAIIAVDGTVRDARVITSRPLLDQAALDAVRQWRFTPSTLNGVPVPVILTITVDFKLQ